LKISADNEIYCYEPEVVTQGAIVRYKRID